MQGRFNGCPHYYTRYNIFTKHQAAVPTKDWGFFDILTDWYLHEPNWSSESTNVVTPTVEAGLGDIEKRAESTGIHIDNFLAPFRSFLAWRWSKVGWKCCLVWGGPIFVVTVAASVDIVVPNNKWLKTM